MGELREGWLHQVRVVLDLQSSRADLRVAQQIQDQGALEIRNANRLCVSLANQALHRRPRLLDRSIAQLDFGLAIVKPLRGVPDGGVDVFESNGEVDEVQVKVVNPPVLQLLLADGRNPLAIVEGVPQLADQEEVLALHQAVLDCPGHALARLLLIAVICGTISYAHELGTENVPQAPSNNR